ncbi:uncharacterized protein LOC135090532 isoform X2 [Scylla paramamosain]
MARGGRDAVQRRRAVLPLLCYLITWFCLPTKASHLSHLANLEEFSHPRDEETPSQEDYLRNELDEATPRDTIWMEDMKQRGGLDIPVLSSQEKTVGEGLLDEATLKENGTTLEVIRERRDLNVPRVGREKRKEERFLDEVTLRENGTILEVIREGRGLNVPRVGREKTEEERFLDEGTLRENGTTLQVMKKRRRKTVREHFADEINIKITRERRRKNSRKRFIDGNTTETINTRLVGANVRKRRTSGATRTPSKEGNDKKHLYKPGPTSSRHEVECLVKPSCSSRDIPQDTDIGHMFPCMCDDHCYLYGDCCHDHVPVSYTAPAIRPACMLLTPIAGRHYRFHRSVFMVNWCPEGSEPNLKDRCEGEGSSSYLEDIPVFSKTTGIGYANIFCAFCHNDIEIYKYEISVSCLGTVNVTSDLENMMYHSGELRWSLFNDVSENTIECLLDVAYPPSIGRWCQSELVDTCHKNWASEENVTRCSAYNYYVQSENTVYKNRDCALCNGVPHDEIQCLSLFKIGSGPPFYMPPSLLELFEVRGNCKDNEVWDVLYRRCENVACGFLFTLQDGKCERSNATISDDSQSYLNSSCYVLEYDQNAFTTFPNESIYLNETRHLYRFGEYELNGSLIRVCDEKKRWTPFMHILSSVLIIISLVCLLAHMAIFLMLPERRNIPSMNLFSMTVSLFMAEFLFLTFFQLKFNHITCIVSGVLMYYFLSVSFLWMNVMSIDIFRTFYYTSSYRTKSRKIFTQYSLYAWILPLGGVTLALVVDEVWPDYVIAPHFGTDTCWINNKWGLVTFFTFPSGMVILANLILYMVSVRNIYTQIKSGEMASSTIRKSDGSSKYSGGNSKTSVDSSGRRVSRGSIFELPNCKENLRSKFSMGSLRKHRGRLILYCKLALIMGMTWIFAFISIHTKNIVFEYFFIITNGLQGAFIFVAFDLKKKVWEELSIKTRCLKKHENYTVRRKSKAFTASLEGVYKSRPNSQRFNELGAHSASLDASRSQPSHTTAEIEV